MDCTDSARVPLEFVDAPDPLLMAVASASGVVVSNSAHFRPVRLARGALLASTSVSDTVRAEVDGAAPPPLDARRYAVLPDAETVRLGVRADAMARLYHEAPGPSYAATHSANAAIARRLQVVVIVVPF